MAIYIYGNLFYLKRIPSANVGANIFHTRYACYGLIVLKRSAKILLFYETPFIITSATDIL